MRWFDLAVAAAAIGCAHPYSAGYHAEITAIGDGRLMIRSAPSDERVSEGLATQHAYIRATEACPNGYEIIDQKVGTASSRERVAIFGRRTVRTPEVTLIIRCR